MKYFRFFLFFLFIFQINIIYSYTNISSCSDDPGTSGEWRLNQSISTGGGSCLVLLASNILLDCQSFLINSTNSSNTTYGIDALNNNNITIRNCNIKNFGNENFEGGLNMNGNGMYVENVNLSNNYYGLMVLTSSSPGGVHSFINASNNMEAGILVQSSSYHVFSNTVTNDNTATGINLVYANNNNFSSFTSTRNNYGIRIETSSTLNNFIDGDIRGNLLDNIFFDRLTVNYPKNNTISSTYIENGTLVTSDYNLSYYNNTLDGNYWDDFNSLIHPPYCYSTGTWSFCDNNALSSTPTSTSSSGRSVFLFSTISLFLTFTLIFWSLSIK